MLKNVLLPIILILLTGFGSVYLWFEDAPFSFFGLIGLLTLWFGSMYISYYFFYLLFPNKNNKPLPHLVDLLMYYKEQKKKPQIFTKGGTLGTLFAILLAVGGTFSLIKMAGKYEKYELTNYGENISARVVDIGYQKGIWTYREYEFIDNKGKKHTNKFSNTTLAMGYIIKIRYSKRRPVINKIIEPEEE